MMKGRGDRIDMQVVSNGMAVRVAEALSQVYTAE